MSEVNETRCEYSQAADFLAGNIGIEPAIGLILGSGLGVLADEIDSSRTVDYAAIPGFPVSTVEGHAGRFVAGTLEGKRVIAMQGRFHYYEGYDMPVLTMPVRVMRRLGITTLVVTNSAGGVNPEFKPGDLMLISDHINFAQANPLRGPNTEEFGPRFPDMSTAYSPRLGALARQAAADMKLELRSGVYAFMTGPCYETPAEIRMLRLLGADAVGMSTVPEVITAVHAGLEVLGLSCITNMAAGILDQPLNHAEVMETAGRVRDTFLDLMRGLIRVI